MKKLFWILLLSVLVFQINVKASEDEGVTLTVKCEDLNLAPGESATCDLEVSTISTVSIDNVSLDFESNDDLSITYSKGEFFDGNLNSGHLVLSSTSLKTGIFKLGKIKIAVSSEATYEKKPIVIKNIAFSDSSNTTQLYNSSNVNLEVSVLSNNNNLKSISINKEELKNFSANTLKYDLEVENEKMTLSALAEDENAKIDGLGEKELKYGKNTFEIKVTSQKGSVKTYILNITRPDKRSDVNTLKTLTISDIQFEFKSDTLKYDLEVESSQQEIEIKSTLTDGKASYVKDFGNRKVKLNYGENKILIKVLSEKGSEKVYTLVINRKDDRSDVAKLESLTINGNNINLTDDVYEYNLTLLYRFNKTNIEAKANEKSTLDYKDMDLKVGDNELIIKVTSEKQTVKQYKIKIKRLTEEESKVKLEDIKINGYDFVFNKEVASYNLNVSNETDELEFEFVSNDSDNLNPSISGNKNLKNGSVITISVKDDFGEYVYTINIIKDEPKEESSFGITEISYIVFGIGVLSFISAVAYLLIKRNKNKSKKVKKSKKK